MITILLPVLQPEMGFDCRIFKQMGSSYWLTKSNSKIKINTKSWECLSIELDVSRRQFYAGPLSSIMVCAVSLPELQHLALTDPLQ